MVRKILLICGIASSVLYVASDLLISWWDPNYSYRDQSFSELLAPGSPTRPLVLVLLAIPYGVLVAAFGAGVWASVGPRRAGRITAALLVGYAVLGAVGGCTSRHPRVRSWKRERRRGATPCTFPQRRCRCSASCWPWASGRRYSAGGSGTSRTR